MFDEGMNKELDMDPALRKLAGRWGNVKMRVTRATGKQIKCLEARRGQDASG